MKFAIEFRWKIVAMEIMPDHVHLFLNVKPTDNPSQIMNRIKGRASHHLRLIVSRIAKTANSLDTQLFCFYCWEYFYEKCNRVYSAPKRLNQNTLKGVISFHPLPEVRNTQLRCYLSGVFSISLIKGDRIGHLQDKLLGY